MDQTPMPPQPTVFSRHFFKILALFFVLLAAPLLYVYWSGRNIKPSSDEIASKALQEGTAAYDKALEEDKYGGTSPEETLALFAKALDSADAELASKYFEPPAANQAKWRNQLAGERDALPRLGGELRKYDALKRPTPETALFIYLNADGSVGLQLAMRLVQQSKLWKIEGL